MAWMSPAYAYLNPGDGSLLLQSLYALVASAGVVGGVYWRRLRAWFVRPQPTDTAKPNDPSSPGD